MRPISFDFSRSVTSKLDIFRQLGTQTVCLGGIADMGPGALQEAQSMMGMVINGWNRRLSVVMSRTVKTMFLKPQ